MSIRSFRFVRFLALRSGFAGTRAVDRYALAGSMAPGLRSATVLDSARLSRHWPVAARLPTSAQYAAWP
ncbi:protein of unknown function (plasmid) [Denitratisoma oestradiolicum]|uniref:Uncharacterized protein n=1 Tax=Denitratisoma oestradiolicum TaxID=311182 RepID=A0A6S6Y1I7_9PROT|nr:protein of unknown function [Denitratisoma oestradiolicum]CAB1371315.1 protein of unknown function [Denitratisoma oestradiolicum]